MYEKLEQPFHDPCICYFKTILDRDGPLAPARQRLTGLYQGPNVVTKPLSVNETALIEACSTLTFPTLVSSGTALSPIKRAI